MSAKKVPFQIEERVTLVSVDNTLRRFGGARGAIEKFIGQSFIIKQSAPPKIRLYDDMVGYAWHVDDFVRTDPNYIPPKPPGAPPAWVTAFKMKNEPRNFGAHIEYCFYPPEYGEIKSPPTFTALKSRIKKTNIGWVNKNHACYASLWQAKLNPENKNYFCSCLNTHLTENETIKWLELLKDNHIINKKAKGFYVKGDIARHTCWTVHSKITNESTRRLYLMCCFLRNTHEQPWIVRNTIEAMKKYNLDFFVAYILVHHYSHTSYSGHAAVGTSWNDGDVSALFVLKKAAQMYKYINVTSKEEKPFVGGSVHSAYMLWGTLSSILVNLPKIKTFDELKGLKLNLKI